MLLYYIGRAYDDCTTVESRALEFYQIFLDTKPIDSDAYTKREEAYEYAKARVKELNRR
jgi:hypothetical protein